MARSRVQCIAERRRRRVSCCTSRVGVSAPRVRDKRYRLGLYARPSGTIRVYTGAAKLVPYNI